jgi:hypothetical protein
MGFEPEETLYRLTFEDPGLAGLEVMVREPDLDQLLTMMGLAESVDPQAKGMPPRQVLALFETFAGLLDSWNVTRKGVPVPADFDGVKTQNPKLIMAIVKALGEAFTAPDPTSAPPSADGGIEAQIPMTPLPG